MEIHDIPPDKLKEWAKIMGRKGGLSTLNKYGPEYFRKLRKLSRGRAKTKDPLDKRL